MNILGISAFYHESACCLLQNGRLITAAAEERFTRFKHDPRLPVNAYRFCLDSAGLTPADLDVIAYYENPHKKVARQKAFGLPRTSEDEPLLNPHRPVQTIREKLGYGGSILTYDHHLSHAASAYYFSGFDHAAVLTFDGVGEWATTSYGRGSGDQLTLFEEVHFPHSLGLFYATMTAYLGFRVNSGEYKVMGLAPYGQPRYVQEMRRLIQSCPNGQFALDLAYFDFPKGERMFSEALCDLFGRQPRQPESTLEPFHQDIARSAQLVLEELMLEKVSYLAAQVDSPNLCLAGGVALNCVANGRIRREGSFEKLFIQPAAGDAGGCLGAAALAHHQLVAERPDKRLQKHVYLGPQFGSNQIAKLVEGMGVEAADYRQREPELLKETADRLAAGQVIGWFHGQMEFGPRALGNRSILADPRRPGMRERLNRQVKRRESFRPFAPSVLDAHAADHFDLVHPSPFMLETCQVISELPLPAVTHVDGSARPQTVDPAVAPRFAALLQAFLEQTGCPVLLNTSFNVRGEPIVCTPIDALFCFFHAHLDALVLEDFLLERSKMPQNWPQLLASWDIEPRFAFGQRRSAVSETLYTFV